MSDAAVEARQWQPERPRLRPLQLLLSWFFSALALLIAAEILPGAAVNGVPAAILAAAVIAILNAILPPVVAALRLPLTLVFGFLLVLVLDALMLLAADNLTDGDLHVDGFWSALLVGARRLRRDARAPGPRRRSTTTASTRTASSSGSPAGPATRVETDAPGILFLEIDGLALPVLRRAMRDGNAPNMARWRGRGTHRLTGWETDLSSQTGASQAGILLGSNEDIPAFRWVEKETADRDDVLGSGRLRRARAAARDRQRAAASTAGRAAATCSPARPTP